MKGYTKMIVDAVKCSESDAIEIEDIMRNDIFHSTLDWQTKRQFNKGAKDALEVLLFMRSTDGINYMRELELLYK